MMLKKIKLIPADSETRIQPTDWTKCVVCQEDKNESLIDSSHGINTSQPKGYHTLAEGIAALHRIDSLPLGINITRLDDGAGIEETLVRHKAKWHKNCYGMFSRTKVERVQKRKSSIQHDDQLDDKPTTPVKDKLRYLKRPHNEHKLLVCFFCDTDILETNEEFHKVATMNTDSHVRQMVLDLEDRHLLAKLTSHDLHATDAVYHKKCMTEIYTRHRSMKRSRANVEACDTLPPQSVALAELVSYIEDVRHSDSSSSPIFKMSDLVKIYQERLVELLGDSVTKVHSTRLQKKLLEIIPDLESNKTNMK